MGIFVQDSEAQAREFMQTHPATFPNGYDWKLALATALGFRAMPYTVVISSQGEIARRFTGPVNEAELVAVIESLRPSR